MKDSDIDLIRQSGVLAGQILEMLSQAACPEMSTWELDQLAEKAIRDAGAVPTFKGYRDFPACICVSINEEIVHGIPSQRRILKDGDILSIDLGVTFFRQENGHKSGFIADTAVTIPIGGVSKRLQNLMDTTQQALYAGIFASRAGNDLNCIGGAIEDIGKDGGYGIVREYGGHGISVNKLHDEPFIYNHRTSAGSKTRLKPGMVIAIEPMFNLGSDVTKTKSDGWTVVTQDHTPSAHFEHSILITETDAEILTKRPSEVVGWPSKA
ncbi:MAG: type I methionyl aminopeptidase [Cyanobacteria bacterium]|nr:type I methionyl aminopeptidase [Cyanobacteriota bacterium]